MISEEIRAQQEKDEKALEATRHLYQRKFCDQTGELLLTDILNDLHFFDAHIATQEQEILHNYAHKLLWKIGVWQDFNRWDITRALLGLPKSEPDSGKEK